MASRRVNTVVFLVVMLLSVFCGAAPVGFDDLTLAAESYWNGSDGSGGFHSGPGYFYNSYTDWGGGFYSWDGWAYSNKTDDLTPGLGNQYSAVAGGGFNSANYGVSGLSLDWMSGTYEPIPSRLCFPDSPSGYALDSAYFTNTTYAYYSMKNGDSFAKKFGGATGDDADHFLLKITGKNAAGAVTGVVDFYLADFRFAENDLDYIVDDWRKVDLSSLGVVKTLEFTLFSSDTGSFGMNTPAYFAMDGLTITPEPATFILLGLGGLLAMKSKIKRQK